MATTVYRYASIDRVYRLVKFISLGLILSTGLMIAGGETLEPIYRRAGYIPTVTIFKAHIVGALTLISSIIFVTVFNRYTHRPPSAPTGRTAPLTSFTRWGLTASVLFTGVTGLIVWEPFRWIVPFWFFNLGWDFIFSAKNVHLWSAYIALFFLLAYPVVRRASSKRWGSAGENL